MKLFDLGMIVPEGIELSFGESQGDILLMAEIRRSPVDMVVYQFIPLFIGFHTSQVMQDFSHQQYQTHRSNVWLQNVIFLQILLEIQFVVSVRKIQHNCHNRQLAKCTTTGSKHVQPRNPKNCCTL